MLKIILIVLCLSVCAVEFHMLGELGRYRDEYCELLQAGNKNLQLHNVNMASSYDEFYSQVKQAIELNDLEISSTQPQDPGNVLALKLSGDYYALIKTFADFENMPFASRINSLKITGDGDFVNADLTIEAFMAK